MKQDQFLADALIAQEIALSTLINSLLKFHPEITADFITSLEHILKNAPIPSVGARKNLTALVDAVRANQPIQQDVH